MLTFWLMYLFPAGLALSIKGINRQKTKFLWILVGFLFIFLIGLRYEVGGDWFNYLRHYNDIIGLTLYQAISNGGDIGYVFLNWLAAYLELPQYIVNLMSAAIFTTGLIIFCRKEDKPWIALSVSVPYLVVVVSMGYTRQSIAIGLFLWAIAHLERGHFKHYIMLTVTAALFHKTAVLLIPLGLFLYGKGKFTRIIATVLVGYGAWDLLLSEQQEALWKNYVEAQMVSEGAKIRALMNLLPSLLFLFYRKRWKQLFPNYWFWFWIALGSILSVLFVDIASTAIDRITLYFIPIQLAVFSRLPRLASKTIPSSTTTISILLLYSGVLFVWLNFATHAEYWLPYQNILFQ